MRASETQAKERVESVFTIQLRQSALLQVVAATHEAKDFVRNMVRSVSALLPDVTQVFTAVVSAASIVSNQSALGNGAPQPCVQREGVSSTAVAAQKCA